MKKIKTFFYVLKNSIVSPKYYNDILETKMWFSIKYFLVLSFFASLVFTAFSSVTLVPEATSEIKAVSQNIRETYPADLTINIKDGAWETNKEDPVKIPMPAFGAEQTGEEIPSNLAVFDKNGTIDKLDDYNTVLLFNDENIVFKNETEAITAQPLSTIPDLTLDKETIDSLVDTINEYIKFLPFVLPVGVLLFIFIFQYVGGLPLVIVFIGVILYVISILTKKKIELSKAIQISIHAITAPVLFQLITVVIPQIDTYLPGWFFISSLGLSIYYMFKMRGEADLKKIEK